MNKDLPKVKIDTVSLNENYYSCRGFKYKATNLIEHSKKYEPFDLPLAGIDLSRNSWNLNDLDDFIHHADRVRKADLKYPIILDDCGAIADGMHRICKAVIMGYKTIKAIRLEAMPNHDGKEETND